MTRRLSYDMARCITPGCAFAAMCARKLPGRPGCQSFTEYPGGVDCPGYIHADDEDGA